MVPARGTMDFFAAQAAAKRRTTVLVLLFALSIVLTVVIADLGIGFILSGTGEHVGRGVSYLAEQDLSGASGWWSRFGDLLLPVTAAVLAIVAVGTAWHAIQLGGDAGDSVARMLGGRLVDRLTQDPGERRAMNVLEEMALASALPVPRLYLLEDEPGINAFAAGRTADRAVVAVTRGALDELSRDELQGVLAHELSHVLNADVRLNMRLMALAGGLAGLAMVGRIVLSSQRYRGFTSSSRRRSNGGAVLGIGLSLLVAGAIGVFFARLLRMAVSRQREFLADAAAVQFTRNPGGLSGALSKIAERGSALASPHAPEAAHLFFSNGTAGFFSGFLSTHPPLEERIRRLGAPPAPARVRPREAGPAAPQAGAPLAGTSPAVLPTIAVGMAAAASIGRPAPEHLQAAASALAAFPPGLADAARGPFSARGVALALLLDADPAVRARQLAAISEPALGAETARLGVAVDAVPRPQRLALLSLALPALDGLTGDQAKALVSDLSRLADADERLTLYEWALQRMVRRRLAPRLGAPAPAIRARALEQVQVEALELLSSLAWVGQRDPAAAQAALDAGVGAMGLGSSWRLLPRERFTAASLDTVLTRLDEASPQLKSRLLAGAAATVLADGRVTVAESELLRAVAGSLGLPMPPLPPGQGEQAAA